MNEGKWLRGAKTRKVELERAESLLAPIRAVMEGMSTLAWLALSKLLPGELAEVLEKLRD